MRVILNTNDERNISIRDENPSELGIEIVTDAAAFDLAEYMAGVDFKLIAAQKGSTHVVFNGKMLEYFVATRGSYDFHFAENDQVSVNGGVTTYRFRLPLMCVFNLDGQDSLRVECRNYEFEDAAYNNLTIETIEGQGLQRYIPKIQKQLLQFSGHQKVEFPMNCKNVVLTNRTWDKKTTYTSMVTGNIQIKSNVYSGDLNVNFIENRIQSDNKSMVIDGAEVTSLPLYAGVVANNLSLEADFDGQSAFYSVHFVGNTNVAMAATSKAQQILGR